ncbi:U24-ctenitoxin-Pn1a-like [Uloborus diversus]|uniref:U24-ctenitoxin-Pn1a-like n=1 Tax=Uloborus diversus TaxID=327109 RepID=UPI002409829D|nr:U24-ctenitoxin-Pn1a-like [Uloborus diversus]
MKSFLGASVLIVCLGVSLALTECEEHRQRELASDAKIKLVPKCDKNGDYEDYQCFEGSPFCMCWRKDGSHITEPSKRLETCLCHVHRDTELTKAQNGMVGNFIPQCEESGYYSKKQCHGSTGFCWCSDEKGNKVGDSVRGELEC